MKSLALGDPAGSSAHGKGRVPRKKRSEGPGDDRGTEVEATGPRAAWASRNHIRIGGTA